MPFVKLTRNKALCFASANTLQMSWPLSLITRAIRVIPVIARLSEMSDVWTVRINQLRVTLLITHLVRQFDQLVG